MHCFYHPGVEAVGTCKNCGRGVCSGCANDVGNGLACRARCEAEVLALNRIIAQNKVAYDKARSVYGRAAILYGLVALAVLTAGVLDWRGFGWVLVPAGLIFAFTAYVQYSAGKKFQ